MNDIRTEIANLKQEISDTPSASESGTKLSYRICQLLSECVDSAAKDGATHGQLLPLYELVDALKENRDALGNSVTANT